MSNKGNIRAMTMRSKREVFEKRNIYNFNLRKKTDSLVKMLLGTEKYTTEDVKKLNEEIDELRLKIRELEWVLGFE
jgi:polyhydroxyalkanoate synthesis regulator phasin